MMIETRQKTVGEYVVENPAVARVFEKYGIDYCCSGKRPLEDVCRDRNLPTGEVLRELESAGPQSACDRKDWTRASLRDLIAHIVSTHHEYLKLELPRLDYMMSKVLNAHGDRHPESLAPLSDAFADLKQELEGHLWKEENVLFPSVETLEAEREAGRRPAPPPFGSVRGPISAMEHEHDNAGRALETMRRSTKGYQLPDDACNTYRTLFFGLRELEADLHQHIHLENNILFPRAAALE